MKTLQEIKNEIKRLVEEVNNYHYVLIHPDLSEDVFDDLSSLNTWLVNHRVQGYWIEDDSEIPEWNKTNPYGFEIIKKAY